MITRTTFIPAQQFAPIVLQLESGTSGTISFGPRIKTGDTRRAHFPGMPTICAQFVGIHDAERVRALMQDIADNAPDDSEEEE